MDQVPREREFFESGHSDDEVILQLPVASIAKFGNFAGSRVFRLDWCLRGSGEERWERHSSEVVNPPADETSKFHLPRGEAATIFRSCDFFLFLLFFFSRFKLKVKRDALTRYS